MSAVASESTASVEWSQGAALQAIVDVLDEYRYRDKAQTTSYAIAALVLAALAGGAQT